MGEQMEDIYTKMITCKHLGLIDALYLECRREGRVGERNDCRHLIFLILISFWRFSGFCILIVRKRNLRWESWFPRGKGSYSYDDDDDDDDDDGDEDGDKDGDFS